LFIVGIVALLVVIQARQWKSKGAIHGSARLANPGEMNAYRYVPGSLVLGYEQRSRQLLALDQRKQEEHILVVGPTGRGKTTAIILPGLLTETGQRSLFAIDPKHELYQKSAGALTRYYQVWCFAPMESISHHYNPLVHVHSMEDAQDLARAWIENTGQNTKTPFFERNVELIITAAVLH
jgi:type IV secretory pathway TraG/TraD family ATPase VirD4